MLVLLQSPKPRAQGDDIRAPNIDRMSAFADHALPLAEPACVAICQERSALSHVDTDLPLTRID